MITYNFEISSNFDKCLEEKVKLYKNGALIEACYDTFNEIMEYNVANKEPVPFKKNH